MDITCSLPDRTAHAVWRLPPLSLSKLQELRCPRPCPAHRDCPRCEKPQVRDYERVLARYSPYYWSYGLEANRHVLSAFTRYAAGQHLIAAPEPEELFAPETGEEFII